MTNAEQARVIKGLLRQGVALGALADSIISQCQLLLESGQGNVDAPPVIGLSAGVDPDDPRSTPRFGRAATIPRKPE
ncbi:MAG: hypothetical protein ABI119_06030 [Gemmatimonadaceae bacterium]